MEASIGENPFIWLKNVTLEGMIMRIFENLLGIYRLSEWSNEDFMKASKPIDELYTHTSLSYTMAPQGLTRYTQNSPEIVICRTQLGRLFPSLRYVSLEDAPISRPNPSRRYWGYINVAFLLLALFVVSVIIFQNFAEQGPVIVLLCAFIIGLLCLGLWLGTMLEFYCLTSGIRKIIAKT